MDKVQQVEWVGLLHHVNVLCGPELGRTSAVRVATYLVPLAQILSLEDATCKMGGAA